MIYLPSQRILFVHNPKCAGTSIVAALERICPDAEKWWGRGYVPRLDSVRDLAHLQAHEAASFLGPDRPVRMSFGVVRDPYTRFASALEHFRRHSGVPIKPSAETFVERYLNHTAIRFDWRYVHFCPQYAFFYQDGARLVDRIWRQEAMGELELDLTTELSTTFTLDQSNARETQPEVLSPRVIAAINHFYARDFQLFGYPMKTSIAKLPPTTGRPLYAEFETLWPEERGLDRSELVCE